MQHVAVNFKMTNCLMQTEMELGTHSLFFEKLHWLKTAVNKAALIRAGFLETSLAENKTPLAPLAKEASLKTSLVQSSLSGKQFLKQKAELCTALRVF
jgi:hypothetical protein